MSDQDKMVQSFLDKLEKVVDRQNELAEKLERLIGMMEQKEKNCDRHAERIDSLEVRIGKLEVKTAAGAGEKEAEKDNLSRIISIASLLVAAASVYFGIKN